MKKITLLLLVLLFVPLAAYSKDSKQTKESKEQKKDETEDQKQRNYGYAIIYKAFNQLQWAEKIVDFKVDAQQVTDVVKDLDQVSKKFETRFDELKKDYPALKYDDTGRPEILEKKNKDQGGDRVKSFLPIVGKTGPDFERNFLLFLSGSLNELHYLSKNLAEMEPNEGLKKFLGEIESETKRVDNRMQEVLNKRYFKHNTFKAEKKDKKDKKD